MRPAPYPCRFLDRAVSSKMDSSCSCDRWPDKLRGHMERDAAEYKRVVLALIFLGSACFGAALGIYPGPRTAANFQRCVEHSESRVPNRTQSMKEYATS